MSLSRVYLDHNATSPMRQAVRVAFSGALELGNPSSVHAEGRRARAAVERARAQVATLAGVGADEVILTSGGSEANAAALRPGALLSPDGRPVRRLVVGAGEHASVLAGHGFPAGSVSVVRLDPDGRIDLDHLAARLEGDEATLVSVQVANNETGAVQPVAAVAELARARRAALHLDAVQAAGRIPLGRAALGADALTLSAHKLGGPLGAGALVVRAGAAGPDLALIRGGGQERGLRGGTENVPALVGFGVAAELAAADLPAEADRLRGLREGAERAVRRHAPEAVVFAGAGERLPNTLAFAVPGVPAETALISLDLAGIAVSSGSACSSGKVGRSHVLTAMGVPSDLAAGAIRVSFGWNSTPEDADRFASAFESMLQRLYERRRARAA